MLTVDDILRIGGIHQLAVGDRVITCLGERGVIDHRFDDGYDSYDWWVRITFMFQGQEYETLEPYKNSELHTL